MHVAVAALDLALIAVAAIGCHTRRRSRRWAWVLLVASAAWLPVDNGVLEGPVLIGVTRAHGLTLSDLLGIGGAIVAGMCLRPPRRGRTRTRWLLASAAPVAVVLVVGFLVASFVTDVRVDEHADQVPAHRPAHRHLHHHASALVQL